ncbi:hypothetical protein DVH05_012676 [Phytophthora capsici]|nr:hypothetical protein DVH05_012676 [Phytophthora capsici]
MVRICGFELFKYEKDVTEAEWRDYFLSARLPDNNAYKTLDKEVKMLCMDLELQDAESRLSRLMADFYEIVDRLNMEDVVQSEPKKVIEYLVEALRPPTFRAAVKDQLGRQTHKQTKANIQVFLKWVRSELEGFMRFEAHIPSTAQAKTSTKTEVHPGFASNSKKTQGGRGTSNKNPSSGQRSGKPAGEGNPKSDTTPKISKTDKKCFKCGDQTHGVFQCPNIASPTEAKELYEKSTGKRC